MESNTLSNITKWTCTLGLMNHLVFHFYEPRHKLLLPSIALAAQPALILLSAHSVSTLSIRIVLNAYSWFLGSLTLSIIIYRLSPFHPLASYPGPILCRTTKFWAVFVQWTGHQHIMHKKLHDRYGSFVRIGPNELSIVDVDAVSSILGANGLPKGRYYDARKDPNVSGGALLSLQGDAHGHRRRLWNRGMSSESLEAYEDIIANRAQQMLDGIQASNGNVDLAKWLSYFSFDVMGDMAFGGGFELLRDGDEAGLWAVIDKFVVKVSLLSQIPWASQALPKIIPSIGQDVKRLRKFGVDSAKQRIQSGSTVKDLWYHLTDEAGLEKVKPPMTDAVADGALAIIAGSDTTSSALSCLFFALLSDPKAYKRAQDEVDAAFSNGESIMNAEKHDSLPFVKACLNETLRLYPPVATMGSRRVPTGGRMIASRFVPEGTEVLLPPYSLHRDSRYFAPFTDSFWPDRWLEDTRPQRAHNTAAFIPFSYGPANCVGRNLATKEMLMVISALLQKFEMQFPEGFDKQKWPESLRDYFVTTRGPLPVHVQVRG